MKSSINNNLIFFSLGTKGSIGIFSKLKNSLNIQQLLHFYFILSFSPLIRSINFEISFILKSLDVSCPVPVLSCPYLEICTQLEFKAGSMSLHNNIMELIWVWINIMAVTWPNVIHICLSCKLIQSGFMVFSMGISMARRKRCLKTNEHIYCFIV